MTTIAFDAICICLLCSSLARNLHPWQSQPGSEGPTWWETFSFPTNFSSKVRAGKWEEAIAELNTATRFLESGAFFLGHQQEPEQMLQVKSRKVGGSLPVGVLHPLLLASPQNASRTAGEPTWYPDEVWLTDKDVKRQCSGWLSPRCRPPWPCSG